MRRLTPTYVTSMYNEYNIKKKRLDFTTLNEAEHSKLRDETLSDVRVTSLCLGAAVGCHLAEWSSGRTGRAHFCDSNKLAIDYYSLLSDIDTDALVRATRAGKCSHTALDIARRNIDGKTKKERQKDMKTAIKELKQLILLVGNKFDHFYIAWRISLNPSDKEFYELFMDNKRDMALMECVVMLGSPEYRNTVPRLPHETKFEHDKRFRLQAVMHLNVLSDLALGSYAEWQIDSKHYNVLEAAIQVSIALLKNNRLLDNCFLDFNSEAAVYLFIESNGYGHAINDDARKKMLG
jgi:hypothetical protein